MQDLFTSIDNYLAQEGHYAFRVRLDASHPVYRGHFPGHPVLPGVCTLQLVGSVWSAARDAGTASRRSANASSSA
ncbi:MAG: hypothetical protein ACLRM8_02525 [Alistipes sp.]